MGVAGRIDAFQRRHGWAALPVAVAYKFVDDKGTYLAALLTYYGFVSLFPLLLLAVTVLGYLLHGDPAAQQAVLSSALRNVPVIGDQIRDNVHSFSGSAAGLVVGVVVAVYGALGVTQAAQHALDEVWAVPRAERPSIWAAYGRGALVVVLVGLGMMVTAGLSTLVTTAGAVSGLGGLARSAATLVGTLVNIGLFLMAYHLLPNRRSSVRERWVGAVVAGVTWQVLLAVGTWLVGTRLQGASAAYGLFGIVLGLLAWLYLAASVFVLCAELDAVLARRLHPRSLMSMYPDDRDTTVADRRAYASYAESERQKHHQSVDVSFDDQAERSPDPAPDPAPERAPSE
jgi:YihY family inner membrane protein